MYGIVQSLESVAMATNVESGESGFVMSISLGTKTDGLSMTSRKTPGGGGCKEELILERASASSFFFHLTLDGVAGEVAS
jgi:hypothetical protein